MKRLVVTLVFFFMGMLFYSQQTNIAKAPWRLLSYSGNLNVNGSYYKSFFEKVEDENYGYQYGVGGFISTQSYVYHPNFLTLIASIGYQPQFGEVVSSQIPDYVTGTSALQYNINANFLQSFDYKINTYFNYVKQNNEDRFFNRNITDKKWGAELKYNRDYSVRANFEQENIKQIDNNSSRELEVSSTYFKGSILKSFFDNDRNELSFNIQRTTSEQINIFKNSNEILNVNYSNTIYLKKNKTIPFNSRIFFSKQKGTFNDQIIGLNESLTMPIAKKLNFHSRFGLRRTEREFLMIKNLNLSGSLNYQLYSSLRTNLQVNYNRADQIKNFNLNNKSVNFRTNYNKNIPFLKGNIRLGYSYEYQIQNRTNEKNDFTIFNEEQVLQDASIVILNRPNVIIESIVIKDITGTLIYEENLDYILIQRGIYVEIQRLIGGNILNNALILIDYNTFQNESYDFNGKGNVFETRLNILDNLLRLEYLYAKKIYEVNSGNKGNLGLNAFTQYTYGAHLNYNICRGGISYLDNSSEIMPFKLWSYYFSVNKSLSAKLRVIINARVDDYIMYFNEGDTNKISTLSSDMAYNLNPSTRFVFNLSYNEQKGIQQNFNLISGSGEVKKRFNQLLFSLSLRYFNRTIPNIKDKTSYFGANFRIQRNF
ncbi:hypothetical protein [Aestuariivivens sp. NBU2969]|uniref:hypothetical protein n=1 Tax=Aestuariivivens sp. NBU2969 TaxID=2873267 RepID=UPI001CBF40BD|nr:hypothetical protein [Aestuariivivens sp. NBU2969]